MFGVFSVVLFSDASAGHKEGYFICILELEFVSWMSWPGLKYRYLLYSYTKTRVNLVFWNVVFFKFTWIVHWVRFRGVNLVIGCWHSNWIKSSWIVQEFDWQKFWKGRSLSFSDIKAPNRQILEFKW